MKEVYSFSVKRKVEKEVPHVKKTKDGPVETTKKVKKIIENRVVFTKPSVSDIEDAEFFYGQKYNEYINAGFLTKAMLAKKMGDLGGMTSKKSEDLISELMVENMEASRTIEFFEGAENLDEEQKEKLKEAKLTFARTAKEVQDYEEGLRSQFNQTADSKAEQKLIEWFILNFSYFEDQLEGEKKELFPLFEGENFSERRNFLLLLQEKDEDVDDVILLRNQNIFESSYTTLIRAATLWYNKVAENQEDMEKALKEFFPSEEEDSDEQ